MEDAAYIAGAGGRMTERRTFTIGGHPEQWGPGAQIDVPRLHRTYRVVTVRALDPGTVELTCELVTTWGWRYRARKRWLAWRYALEQWCDDDGVRALLMGFAAGAAFGLICWTLHDWLR